MYNNNLFNQQMKVGEIGEALVANYLNKQGYKVEDVTKDNEYFSKDIDFFYAAGDYWTAIDVKYDTRFTTTGNLFIEDSIGYERGTKPGWLHYCQAEYIYYVDAATHMCLIFKMEEMKQYIEENKAVNGGNIISRYCDDGYKVVKGYCVPAAQYKLSGNHYEVIDLKESF